jgi:hypothetical protein
VGDGGHAQPDERGGDRQQVQLDGDGDEAGRDQPQRPPRHALRASEGEVQEEGEQAELEEQRADVVQQLGQHVGVVGVLAGQRALLGGVGGAQADDDVDDGDADEGQQPGQPDDGRADRDRAPGPSAGPSAGPPAGPSAGRHAAVQAGDDRAEQEQRGQEEDVPDGPGQTRAVLPVEPVEQADDAVHHHAGRRGVEGEAGQRVEGGAAAAAWGCGVHGRLLGAVRCPDPPGRGRARGSPRGAGFDLPRTSHLGLPASLEGVMTCGFA